MLSKEERLAKKAAKQELKRIKKLKKSDYIEEKKVAPTINEEKVPVKETKVQTEKVEPVQNKEVSKTKVQTEVKEKKDTKPSEVNKEPKAKATSKPAEVNKEPKPKTSKPAEEKVKKTETPVKEEKAVVEAEEKKVVTDKRYHVSQNKETLKWGVKFGGGAKVIKYFNTQKEAIAFAKHLSETQDGSLVIHKVDGKIRKQNYNTKKDEKKED